MSAVPNMSGFIFRFAVFFERFTKGEFSILFYL
jgi:hypothetical protein